MRAAVRAQRARRGQGRGRRRCPRSSGSSRSSCSSPRRPTSPASPGRQRRLGAARRGVRRRRPARAHRGRRRGAAARRPGRGRAGRRGRVSGCRGSALPAAPGRRTARAFADGDATPVEPRDAATVVLLRTATGGGGLEVYLLRRHGVMAFAAGMCVFPGGGVDPRDFDADDRLGRADRRRVGRAARHRRGARPGAGLRRRPRDVRGVRRAAGRPTATTVVADTTGDDWEADRVALEARELSFTDFLARRGLVLRTDLLRRLGALGHPGVRAAALRHPVLRRRAARGPGHPRRVDRVRRGGLAAVREALDGGRRRRDADAAADVPHLPRGRPSTPRRRRARAAAAGPHADVRRRRSREWTTTALPVDPRPAASRSASDVAASGGLA